jgi:nucleoside-diphosphate-sugar epimerase
MTRVLLTGATGSFGRYLARELLARGCEVVAVTRGRDDDEARRRVLGAVRPRDADPLITVRGNLGAPGLGLTGRPQVRECDFVLHAAATTEFGLPLADARRTNLEGTLNVLGLARTLPQLRGVGHVGTAFVAGRRTGRIHERELQHSSGFVNSYEQSKYEAELAVRASGLPVSIFRPSVIVEEERTAAPTALRFVLQSIAGGRLSVLPGPEQATLDVMGAGDAAATIVELVLNRPSGGVFHLASGDEAPLVSEVVLAGAGRPVTFLEPGAFERRLARLRERAPRVERLYRGLESCVGALAYPKVFDISDAAAALGRPVTLTDPLLLVARTLREAA